MQVSLTSWRSRLVAGLAAAMFVVPAFVLLAGPAPSRFGFQMYSGYGEVSATWQDADGADHGVDLDELVASARVETDWTSLLPPHLCRHLPKATSVEVRQTDRGGDRVGRLTCPT